MALKINNYSEVKSPMYIIEEKRLRKNLELIREISREADVEFILAFKAFALWKTFPIFNEYINATTASSLFEAKMGYEEFGSKTHTYSPAYTDSDIEEIANSSSHLTFNSLSQYEKYCEVALRCNPNIKLGLRINPEYSEISTLLYNPCAPGTRFGVSADKLSEKSISGISGFHCHCHCESGADAFVRTLKKIEEKFSKWFCQIEWINFGGGHLVTRDDYDVELLVSTLRGFHARYPHLKVIMEPGSAFVWQTGVLVAHVVDVVEDKHIRTAILDVSFTCHMPDCLEMPYQPVVRNAVIVEDEKQDGYIYRLGGCSCLSGDFVGNWSFDHELKVGEVIVFEDMIHYTTVKTTMFNGINHPSIAILRQNSELEILREYNYFDYKSRMD